MLGDRTGRSHRLVRLHHLPQSPRAPPCPAEGPVPRTRRRRWPRASAPCSTRPSTSLRTYRDFEALEAVLEEQARGTCRAPAAGCSTSTTASGWWTSTASGCGPRASWRERAFAAELLGRVGNAKAVPALLETVLATRSEDGDVREIALRALARIADPRAVPPLVESLRSPPSPGSRRASPTSSPVTASGGPTAWSPFSRRAAAMHARAWAANMLGEVRAQRAFPVLVRAPRRPRGRGARQVAPTPSAASATAARSPTSSTTCSPIPRRSCARASPARSASSTTPR